MGEYYIHESVSKRAVSAFFEANQAKKNEIHTLQVYKDGKTLIRIGCAPYSCSDVRENYSLSKSFASTAIGFAYDDGLVTPEDRVVDIFADLIDFPVSDYLAAMTVKNLLTMSAGQKNCAFPTVREAADPVKAFLQLPVEDEPGEHFCYNTGASWMLGAIILRLTGMNLFDYLTVKLFHPLGMHGARWHTVRTGTSEGGAGLQMSNDDVMKFGILYLNRGMYNGKRILSEAWINRATVPYTGSKTYAHDWEFGYGYQFWMNEGGGYRADGAYGQFCYIVPSKDAVVTVQTESADNYATLQAIRLLLDGIYDQSEEPAAVLVPDFAPYAGDGELRCDGNLYIAEPNGAEIHTFSFSVSEDGKRELIFRYTDGIGEDSIRCGNGYFIRNRWSGYRWKPRLDLLGHFDPTDPMTGAASYRIGEEGPELLIRMTNCPHTLRILFHEESGVLEILPVIHPSLLPEDRKKIVGRLASKAL